MRVNGPDYDGKTAIKIVTFSLSLKYSHFVTSLAMTLPWAISENLKLCKRNGVLGST